ncbi:hydroxyethylthiazole kinase [Methyloraptor flagellatus]
MRWKSSPAPEPSSRPSGSCPPPPSHRRPPVSTPPASRPCSAPCARRPRIHAITNPVAQTYTANMLLAVGAEPSMTSSAEEVAAFVAASDALLINLGMLDNARRDASLTAIEVAKAEGVRWVLDPVKVHVSPPRLAFARDLVGMEPAFVRANHAEIVGLGAAEPEEFATRQLAVSSLTTIALSGAVDIVTDGIRVLRVANGHPLMDRVTAMGCAGTAVAAAFLAVEPDPVAAAAAALVVLGIAGEIAAASANGPGSFAIEMLDALYGLDETQVVARARLL